LFFKVCKARDIELDCHVEILGGSKTAILYGLPEGIVGLPDNSKMVFGLVPVFPEHIPSFEQAQTLASEIADRIDDQ